MEDKNSLIYLAYGSNMNHGQMAERCPGARCLGSTYLEDWVLTMPSYANIEESRGSRVPVVLWEISPVHEKTLDGYEQYPTMYDKWELTVELDGRPVTAMVYIMTKAWERRGQEIRPGYEEGILEAYGQNGFKDEEYRPLRFS